MEQVTCFLGKLSLGRKQATAYSTESRLMIQICFSVWDIGLKQRNEGSPKAKETTVWCVKSNQILHKNADVNG